MTKIYMNYCLLVSQSFPLNPTGHSHEKVLIPSIQVPLFWQGLLSHSFMSVKVDGMDYLIQEFYTNMFCKHIVQLLMMQVIHRVFEAGIRFKNVWAWRLCFSIINVFLSKSWPKTKKLVGKFLKYSHSIPPQITVRLFVPLLILPLRPLRCIHDD